MLRQALLVKQLKLAGTPNIAQTAEFKGLLGCFPLRVEMDLLLRDFPKTIAIRTLYSEPDLRVSAYCLPRAVTMPLHDHPDMLVLGVVLHGLMQAKLYTRLGGTTYRRTVRELRRDDHVLIEGATHNLHEFTGLEDTVFLDVLTPDYDHVRRVCTHYREVPGTQQGEQVRLQVDEDPDYEMAEL